LAVSATVALPFGPDAAYPTVAAEGPDGAVFVADPAGGVVDVVDGDGPPAVAEHVSGTINSLSADASSLYVATYTTVYRYDRSTGNLLSHWALPAPDRANASDALTVKVVSTGATVFVLVTEGQRVDVYRIAPASTAPPRLVARTLGAAVGPNGTLYYERTDRHLVSLRKARVKVGPLLADHPNNEGGGVQEVQVVAGGEVWVAEPAGQGLDAGWQAYDATTLAAGASFGGNLGMVLVGSSAGTLVLSGGDTGGCPSTSGQVDCVLHLAGSTGKLGEPTVVGDATAFVGPDPAVVASDPSGADLEVERLS
jgi:hypothetical protein